MLYQSKVSEQNNKSQYIETVGNPYDEQETVRAI